MTSEPGLFEIMYSCRAMRRLKTDEVPQDLLLKLIEAANQAPSGSNLQPQRWIIVRDPEQKSKLAELNRAGVERYMQVQRARVDSAVRQRLVSAVEWQAAHMHELPALIVACVEMPASRRDTFATGLAAGGSIWPSVQNLLLAARGLGLGATPTTLGLSDKPAAREVLGVPDTIEPVVLIPVGYPRGRFGPVTRLPVEQTVRWDRWE